MNDKNGGSLIQHISYRHPKTNDLYGVATLRGRTPENLDSDVSRRHGHKYERVTVVVDGDLSPRRRTKHGSF